MSEIFDRFPTREAFDTYWKETYVPVTYSDVKEAYETFVKEADKKIFISDYQENGCISETDFADNLSQDAQFAFQDALTEAFYDKNEKLYEDAFALYEEAQMEECPERDTALTFHQEYDRLYQSFLLEMFHTFFS